mgnify:CR=1 FL=1
MYVFDYCARLSYRCCFWQQLLSNQSYMIILGSWSVRLPHMNSLENDRALQTTAYPVMPVVKLVLLTKHTTSQLPQVLHVALLAHSHTRTEIARKPKLIILTSKFVHNCYKIFNGGSNFHDVLKQNIVVSVL